MRNQKSARTPPWVWPFFLVNLKSIGRFYLIFVVFSYCMNFTQYVGNLCDSFLMVSQSPKTGKNRQNFCVLKMLKSSWNKHVRIFFLFLKKVFYCAYLKLAIFRMRFLRIDHCGLVVTGWKMIPTMLDICLVRVVRR